MGANASSAGWPAPFVGMLARRHRVVRYDHRDTGRSTWGYAEHPYRLADLAGDAVTVLDALGIERAHAVGMSLGGALMQLLAIDHPGRLLSLDPSHLAARNARIAVAIRVQAQPEGSPCG